MDPTIDPIFLRNYLSFVIDAPIIYRFINEFVGDSDQESNGRPESDEFDTPRYSRYENFDPSEHFDPYAPDESESHDESNESESHDNASDSHDESNDNASRSSREGDSDSE